MKQKNKYKTKNKKGVITFFIFIFSKYYGLAEFNDLLLYLIYEKHHIFLLS